MVRNEMLRPQAWEWPGPRVLLERPDREAAQPHLDALRRAGYAVAVCPGPTPTAACPLAGDDGCAAAHGADLVVCSLPLENAEAREALAALRTQLGHVPLLVEAEATATSRWPELVREDERLEPGIESPELVRRVESALATKEAGRA